MDKDIDGLIRRYLSARRAGASAKSGVDYPSAHQLYAYLNDELRGGELERMLAFLGGNAEGQRLVSQAREIMESGTGWEGEKVDASLVEAAKSLMSGAAPLPSALCPHCGKSITPFKKPLTRQKWVNLFWFLLAVGAFAFSFVFRRYFMQCLVVSVVAGVRWVVEMRAAKTRLLIYKALSDDGPAEQHRLHQHSSRL